MKWVWRVLAGLAAVLLLLAAALAFRLWRSIPPLAGTERVAGLDGAVEVAWDSAGVPHITATTDRDAFRALGYLHARERLWQMESLRRAAEGRLAEILGPAAVSSDRYLRALDIPRAAVASLALLPPASREILDAYVAGVNAWIERPTRPLPPEFLILRVRPAPWTAAQTYEVARLMAWDLANAGFELGLARGAAQLGGARIRELYPWYPDDGAVILQPGTATWRGAHPPRRGAAGPFVPSVLIGAREIPDVPALARQVLEAASISRASNSWVIGGARTVSGRPILANDPHLALRAPAIWYLATLASPSYRVSGVTIAGIPAIVIGRNRRIAWGLTNMEADDADYVIERLTRDSAQVQTPEGWAPVAIERDSIRVRGGAAVPFTLLRTPNGPITGLYPGAATVDSGGTLRRLALRWNAHTPSDELTAMLAVNRAGTWQEFLAAVSGFKSPEQNWIYADVDGNIGYTASGNVPVRRSGQGFLPTPGWTGEGRWERYLAFEELPRALNPPEGFIVTANNRIVGREYPHHLAGNPALPYRAERIRELVLARERHDAAGVRRMQLDSLDRFARWARTLAAAAADAIGRRALGDALRAWDGTMGADRVEPAVFWLWYRTLQRLTFADEVDGYAPSGPFHGWLRAGASPWFDDRTTPEVEDLPALSARAMREAVERAGNRRWGDVHTTVSMHALGVVRPLDRLLRLNVGPKPRAGSLYTVNVAGFGSAPPYTNTDAASWRQVVDLADVENAGMVITTGQSGNPLARRYRDHAERWWNGELFTVPLSRERVREVAVLRLVPR